MRQEINLDCDAAHALLDLPVPGEGAEDCYEIRAEALI